MQTLDVDPPALWSTVTMILIASAIVLLPESAHAASIAGVLCSVVNIILGSMGRALATLAIIFIGVGATLGKVSWGMAITVAVGISVMLGAPSVLFALTGLVSGC